ncbi:MAG: cytochrome c oxidase subunit 3, partial [Rhodospirillaceae bacterium]|nr:cytochrome c oxidase subunit 3 [Rhodospirillaceae bacterium]
MSNAAAHKPNHPYHLVNPSPWPLVGAIAGGVFFMGMVLYMHGKV